MLAVISPAKKLDFGLSAPLFAATNPGLIRQTTTLMESVRLLSESDLKQLMKLSEKLASLNHERFQNFTKGPKPRGSKPAALAFNGDTYQGLAAWDFDVEDFQFAQHNIGILSGLYGLLRPLDAIQPYRLEMGTRLQTERGRTLYEYWGPLISKRINSQLRGHSHRIVVNLASTEYFGAVDKKTLSASVLSVSFQEIRGAERKVIGLFAKRARGMMARYIVKNRIETPSELRDFREGSYRFDRKASQAQAFVFTRKS